MKMMPLSMGKVMQRSTLVVEMHLTWVRWYRFRLWLGSRILKLGAHVIGCGIEIKGP